LPKLQGRSEVTLSKLLYLIDSCPSSEESELTAVGMHLELQLLLLLFITPEQHDIQTIDITIGLLQKENTNHANIKHSTGEIK